MDTSLSVVLPVHNAQSTLNRQIHHLLELLPDLTAHFEVVIVDDASIDETEEVSDDLRRQFPQLRVVRHRDRHGVEAAVQTGLSQTTGDVVFVHEDESPVRSADLQKLWAMRGDEELYSVRVENHEPNRCGRLHMFRRHAECNIEGQSV